MCSTCNVTDNGDEFAYIYVYKHFIGKDNILRWYIIHILRNYLSSFNCFVLFLLETKTMRGM